MSLALAPLGLQLAVFVEPLGLYVLRVRRLLHGGKRAVTDLAVDDSRVVRQVLEEIL